MKATRMEKLGRTLAELIMYAPGNNEPLNGDEVEEVVVSFATHLANFNGEENDVFIQELIGLAGKR